METREDLAGYDKDSAHYANDSRIDIATADVDSCDIDLSNINYLLFREDNVNTGISLIQSNLKKEPHSSSDFISKLVFSKEESHMLDAKQLGEVIPGTSDLSRKEQQFILAFTSSINEKMEA